VGKSSHMFVQCAIPPCIYHLVPHSTRLHPFFALQFTFERNNSIAAIARGEYSNIRMMFVMVAPTNITGNWISERGFSGSCLGKGRGPLAWCSGHDLVYTWMREELNETQFEEAPASCWYFAQYLTDRFIAAGQTPPPIGIVSTPEGGTMIEQWSNFESQSQCVNATCMCSTSGCDQYQPLNKENCTGNGGLYNARIEPLLNMTLKGFLCRLQNHPAINLAPTCVLTPLPIPTSLHFPSLSGYQGENNEGTDAGNSLHGTGYGCMLPTMVSNLRTMFSLVPGTTDPNAPFGIVSIADGTEEGWGRNAYGTHWSQTANYGSLPNEKMPNTFFTLAEGDPWDGYGCALDNCCVETYIPLGPKCQGDFRGLWSVNNTHSFMGYLHPRSKDTMARRLAEQAYATIYADPTDASALVSGPVISGCSVSGSTLTLNFDSALLKGHPVTVSKPQHAAPLSLLLENTATYVLVNASLDSEFLEQNHHTAGNSYGGAYSNGDEAYVKGWVAVMPSQGPGSNQVTLDLSPLGGLTPTAVRYAVGAGGWGSTTEHFSGCGRLCCGPTLDCRSAPCPPNSCPIKAGPGDLPAVPFLAAIENSKCKCIPPQKCDA